MSAIEHQMLMLEKILSFKSKIGNDMLLQLIKSIENNVTALDLKICGKIIIAKHPDETEFIIPVDKYFESNKHYMFKPYFKLVNAVRFRHYGSLLDIDTSLKQLYDYIDENVLLPITNPYILIRDTKDVVYDIFIGVSENIL